MRQSEKELMKKEYQKLFNYYLLSNEESERDHNMLMGQRTILKLFFTDKEINQFENEIRVTKKYIREYFENIESWINQIEKETGEKGILFTWNLKGLHKVSNHYDWLFKEYKGLQLALNNTFSLMERVA